MLQLKDMNKKKEAAVMTPIGRFREYLDEYAEWNEDSDPVPLLMQVGPKLLALVEAVEELTVYVPHCDSDSGYARDFDNVCHALAALKKEE